MNISYGEGTYGKIAGKGHGFVRVGKYCSIASNVVAMSLSNHRTDWVTTYPFPALWKLPILGHPIPPDDIIVGNDVWLGRGALLLEGTKIGDGAVIGAYSVVAGAIATYSVAVGNPAKEVSKRFSDEVIQELLRIAWWDWPEEKVAKYTDLLCSGNIDEFIETVNNHTRP
jgi:acetyltransferase-like isoleucine patch superfamily enzyme